VCVVYSRLRWRKAQTKIPMKIPVAGSPKTKMARSSVLADSGSTPIPFQMEIALARHPIPHPHPSQREGLLREVHAAEEGVEAGVEAEEELRVHR